MNEAPNTYVNNLIGDIEKDSKPFWKYINNQKGRQTGNSTSPDKRQQICRNRQRQSRNPQSAVYQRLHTFRVRFNTIPATNNRKYE